MYNLLFVISQQIVNSFLAIMAIAAVFAILLARLATKRAELDQKINTGAERIIDEKFSESLAKQISKLPIPPDQRNEVAQKLTALLDHEAQQRVEAKNREVAAQYEKVVAEKDKAVHFVEEQYKNVSQKLENVSNEFKRVGTEKKQTEEIVRSMAEGVIMVNNKGEVLLMNPAAEKLLGARKEQKVGKSILSDLKEEHLVSLAQDAKGKEEREIVVQSQSDQTRKVLKASNAIIESEDGKTVGFVSVLSDVTKQKEFDELKTAFVASVTHELRTPLNSVQESLSLLLDRVTGDLNKPQEKLVTIASTNIQRLSRLINDLLDLSKMEARKLQLEPKTFMIDELVKQIIDTFNAWAKSKKVTIESNFEVEKLELDADQDRITQVLTNLTGNALKFTPAGGKITIATCLRKAQDAPDKSFVQVSVQDTGPGIQKKDFQRIFEKFVSLNTAQLQGVSSTGLGLSISKEIVELHGGRIWVESELGKGSRFIIEIPQRNGSVAKH
ncbi:MAG: PAS domain S-box protein [Candidatus Omnitrophica bacterium]|nr:PAS domain S-box protein [Candidatus Omnitrophota bacterium]